MATAKSKAAGAADKGLKVTARPPSFRRAGYSFTAEPRVIPLSELSQEQVDQITGDPSLVSHVVEIEPPPKTE
ncbi:MAG: hypothetical protein ACKVOT_14115 [Polaromonas sp.]